MLQKFALLSFFLPIFASLFCCCLFLGELFFQKNKDRNIRLLITSVGLSSLFCIFHVNNIALFVYPNLFSEKLALINILCLIFLTVSFYFLIFILTKIDTGKKSGSIVYFVISLLVSLVAGIFLFFALTNMGSGKFITNIFFWFQKSWNLKVVSIPVLLFFTILSLRRLMNFLRSSSIKFKNSSVSWILNMLYLYIIMITILFMLYAFPLKVQYSGIILFNLISFAFSLVLCYNIFIKNYLIPVKVNIIDKEGVENAYSIDRKKFEAYLKEQKPYLNSEFKISDFTKHLGTNRTYLSRFINEIYGMNFSNFINALRLEEFHELKSSSLYKGVSNEELVFMAGFKSYESYLKTLDNKNITDYLTINNQVK
ncbi:hypothetical protein [Chryseobacterium oranimense]|uniref:hypothetical protein n=1 Tax=Chryseobacterium oranimense TaxID=421058 RepID=UPI0031DAC6E0